MRIAVIGAGNVGAAVSRAVAAAGHAVSVAAQDAVAARAVADAVAGTATGDVSAAVADADVVVLAVPYLAVDGLTTALASALDGVVVIDATNPLSEDMSTLVTTDRSGAEHIQSLLPAARVVKAFNTVFAANQDSPMVDGTALDGFYAGDDEMAKGLVRDLLTAIGFRPVDTGPLVHARALEQMAFLNIRLNATRGWSWGSGWRLVGPTG